MGTNPLIGPNDSEMGVRFPDMSYIIYARTSRKLAKQVAADLNIKVQEGVYVGNDRSCIYETPAEIRMLRTLGGKMQLVCQQYQK